MEGIILSDYESDDDDSSMSSVSTSATVSMLVRSIIYESEDDLMVLQWLTVYQWWKNQQKPPIEPRYDRVIYDRLVWEDYWRRYLYDPKFEQMIRMKRPSFTKLVGLLRNDLHVNEAMANLRGGPVTPELCVYLTLRYLACGSMDDLEVFISISKSTFYRILSKTMFAINACRFLDIIFPRTEEECSLLATGFGEATEGGIVNCAGVVDGYLLCIDTPSKRDSMNQKSFFSGHYQRMGVNVQACCDSNSIFTYFAVTGPGVMSDRLAAREVLPETGSFLSLTETLPGLFVIIADAAYDVTEKLVPMFYGAQRNNARNDNFNYVASRARIYIEVAFGRMTNKWGILHRPLCQSLSNITLIALTIARLHNFCAKERLISGDRGDDENYNPSPRGGNRRFLTSVPNRYREGCEFPVAPEAEPRLYRIKGRSQIRDEMALRVEDEGMKRPLYSPVYRAALNENIIH